MTSRSMLMDANVTSIQSLGGRYNALGNEESIQESQDDILLT